MKIKFSTSFSLRSSGCKTVSSGGKDKEFYPIRMRVTFRGQRVDFASGYFIEAEKWDADAQKVTRNASDDKGHTASDINRDLLRMATAVEDCFKRYELEECFPTLSQFKDDFNILIMGTTKGVRSGVNTFLDSFNEFMEKTRACDPSR